MISTMRCARIGLATTLAAGALLAVNTVAASPASAATKEYCQVLQRAAVWANDVAMGWYTWADTFGSAYAQEQGDIYSQLASDNHMASSRAGCT